MKRRSRFIATFGLLAVLLEGRAKADPPAFDPSKELLRIAKMKQDDQLLAGFAESRARATPNLTEKELFTLVETVEKVGSPDRAIRMLNDRVKRFPKEVDARVALAKMYVRASQSANAIPVWKDLAAKVGLAAPLALEYAQTLSTTGDHAAALAVLVGISDKVTDDAVEYWRELASLAWDQDDTKTALAAYRKVWNLGSPPPAASSRLMQLLADAGELDEAIVVAKQALAREKNPAHLLFVARLQLKRGDLGAAKRTLDLADDQRALVASTLEYWMLRAEVLTLLRDLDGARDAHRVAFRLDPLAPGVRAALLWDSIERSDLRQLATDLALWAPDAIKDREMWAPTAIGLDRIGRTRDALRFYLLQWKETPNDDLWSLELSEALRRVGQERVAQQLRRRAYRGIRKQALAALQRPGRSPKAKPSLSAPARPSAAAKSAPGAPKPAPGSPKATKATPEKTTGPTEPTSPSGDKTPDANEKLAEALVFLTQQLRGEPEAERIVRRLLATKTPTQSLEEFAIGWYLQEGNVDQARRRLARLRLKRLEGANGRRYVLLLAMADDDLVTIGQLLESSNDLTDGEKAAGYLRLQRDDRAAAPIVAILDHADLTSDATPDTSVLPADLDAPTLRRELRGINERTAPTVGGGGRMTYINDLLVVGAAATGTYVLGGRHLSLTAGASQFEDLKSSAVIFDQRQEIDLTTSLRTIGLRNTTEYRFGLDYQTDGPGDVPLPRLGYTTTFRISEKLTGVVDATFHGRIEDTSFLRVAALRDAVTTDLAFEPFKRTYLLGTLVVLEDHTRTFDYLGFEVGAGLEGGFKILEKVPEWTIGARVNVYGRDNRGDVPTDYRPITRAGEGRSSFYPPSYQQAVIVTRIARGDFFERSRQELVAFPRYDCEADVGVLVGLGIRNTKPAGAGAVRCAVSLRVPGNGYLSLAGEYIKGVTGLAQADNAVGSLTFTQFLR